MPRRNLVLLLLVSVVSFACYHRVQRNTYGRVLGDAIAKIESSSLEPSKASELFEAAMDGMLSQLDDYSNYIPPAGLKEFHEVIDQQFGGVGMEIGADPKTKQIIVFCPRLGSPAHAAGVRPGDRILRIGDAGTQGMSLNDAVGLLRGKPGSTVVVVVQREGTETPVEVKIVRAVIPNDTVLGDTRNADGSWNFTLEGHDHIGYVRITSFADQTANDFAAAMNGLLDQELRGLVLDLRSNPGGFLNSAIDICDMFIRSGVIVSTRRRSGRISQTCEASGDAALTDFPVAVLVDNHTASAAEIVAACLQDHHQAVIVGQRTFGKGTVQEVIDLENGCGAMKLTTASYWRPSGKNIHRFRNAKETDEWGVSPDEGLALTVEGEDLNKLRQWRNDRDICKPNGLTTTPVEPFVDPQLALAVEYIEKELSR